jgi:hypothetical protein
MKSLVALLRTLLAPSSAEIVAEASDLRLFLRAVIKGERFEPTVRRFGDGLSREEPSPENWLAYYGFCVQYITSLHNQFIAVLSIQGALAIGCLAAIDSAEGSLVPPILGVLGFVMEVALTWIAFKLFRQHCVTCWMLARVEQDRLGLPDWANMKALLGTKGSRLFTSPAFLS